MISVILPTYNERENIVPLVAAIDAVIIQSHEIIVVDDDSPDGTSDVVSRMIESGRVPALKLKTRLADRGLTKSLREGIALATGDTIIWMDCDFSMPPEVIPRLLAKIGEGSDIAVGSRFVKGGQAKKGVGISDTRESLPAILLSSLLNVLLRLVLHWSFRDWTSGFIAVRREVLQRIRLSGDYGEYFMDLMFRAILLGYRIVEIPYVCAPRRAGESKTAPNARVLLKRGVKYLWMTARLQGVRAKRWVGADIARLP